MHKTIYVWIGWGKEEQYNQCMEKKNEVKDGCTTDS